ncbi:ubiquitin-activating enzyme [Sulfurifustis variabilis]|uniref:Ubiquitin-activating enzyme n=1 Tax=Sulfurifustis variabilis TaxID=1675686 RepID=A0A1B4V7S4_9GAMM|nr:ThiF family adenylyltransferase [Sulfurifustis variabilis]BAU49583.1 ubiquitin-activating enzyme [Sulfurifustis variabilis]
MLDKQRLTATAIVEAEVISRFQGARPLTDRELAAHGKQFAAGWQLPGLLSSGKHQLHLLLPEGFPFPRPRVAVNPVEPVLKWPHLEEGGLLCIASDEAPHSPENPIASVVHAIDRAQTLVNDCLEGRGFEHFEDEFVSYWNRWAKTEQPVRSLCHPDGPSRLVRAWFGKSFTVVAEDDAILRAWLKGFFGEKMERDNFTPREIPFIWLEKVPRPADYPGTVGALLRLVQSDDRSKALLEGLLLDQAASNKTVLLGCRTRHGVGLGAVRILKPQATRGRGDPLIKGGFRGTPPKSILLARYSAAPVVGANVIRCDPSWVHGRDHNPAVGVLSTKSAVILGVGSVGSSVATLLAKSGVGKITLVDPQLLASENTGRHELGANSVERGKAAQLATSLRQRFPHLAIEAEGKSWQEFARIKPEQLTSVDLIISTMGAWSQESELNAAVLKLPSFAPILYGWTEPHAAAGHAVVFMDRTACLRCLTDDLGELRTPVTSWSGDTTKQIPACGGSFQPYGAVELEHTIALIAELALDVLAGEVHASTHRVWIGRCHVLQRAGGHWNPGWVKANLDPGDGGRVVELSVSGDPHCPACRAKA